MKRRDFLKSTLLTSGLVASGLTPRLAWADWGNWRRWRRWRRRNKDFYRTDAYCHFCPLDWIDKLESLDVSGKPNGQRPLIEPIPPMWDTDERVNMMDEGGVDVSIFTPVPMIETAGPGCFFNPVKALEAAQYVNDRFVDIVASNPDRFKSVALLPTNLPSTSKNVTIMLDEFERAVTELGAVGAAFAVSPLGKPPDHEDYMQLYAKAVDLGVPLWIHPSRPPILSDYAGEGASKYLLWLTLDWLLDTSIAMARIAYSGVFDVYPDLKIICHHMGALIPLFTGRLDPTQLTDNTSIDVGIPASKPYIDHFKKFYVDTVTSNDVEPSEDIIKIVWDFFEPGHVLFGTDACFSPDLEGVEWTLRTRHAIEGTKLTNKEVEKIYSENIMKIIPT